MSSPAVAAAATTRQIAGVAAAATGSRIFAAAALAPVQGDTTVTRERSYCAQAKTVHVLPRALRFQAAGSCATTVTASKAAGVSPGNNLQHNTSSHSDTTPSSGSVGSCTNRSGGSDVEGLRTRSNWPRRGKEHGRTRWWARLGLRVGSCCSQGRCPRCSDTLAALGRCVLQWTHTFRGQRRPSPLSLWVSSFPPPSLSACTGLSLYKQSHCPLSSSQHGVFRRFYASFSFLDGVPPLCFSPHFLSGSSAPLQTARRCHELYTRSPSADVCLSSTAVSALFGFSSLPTSSSLHNRYLSQFFHPGVWGSSAASLTQSFVAFSSSSASRRSFCAASSPCTSVSHETSSSLLHPTRLWPCAQQLHTSLLLSVLQRGEIAAPTDVQERSVPSLLAGESSLIVAPTGSGKTLAWALPLLSTLLHADRERLAPYARQPRLLVLVPSRELAQQLLQELRKHFSSAGVSIASAAAGQSYVKEVRALTGGRLAGDGSTTGADVLITTPARLLLHLHKRNINLRRVRAVVVEEADTLCDTFYEQELLLILNALHHAVGGSAAATLHATAAAAGCTAVRGERREGNRLHYQRELEFLDSRSRREFPAVAGPQKQQTSSCGASKGGISPKGIADAERPPVQLVFVAATKTGALGRFLRKQLEGVPLTFICAPDAHLTNPGVQQVFVPLGGEDRLSRLLEVLDEQAAGAGGAGAGGGATANGKKTIVFCNTVNSCRAVDLTLVEKGYRVSCLHGMMPFKLRKTSFQRFKEGQTDILVCTNVASRGLDINGVEHVIMFDFPQSLADYLHRSGRTARGGETGRVTLLFSKRNLPLIHQIQNISKATLSSPELRHASPRVRRLLRLEERWRELVNMRYASTSGSSQRAGLVHAHTAGSSTRCRYVPNSNDQPQEENWGQEKVGTASKSECCRSEDEVDFEEVAFQVEGDLPHEILAVTGNSFQERTSAEASTTFCGAIGCAAVHEDDTQRGRLVAGDTGTPVEIFYASEG